MGDVRNHCANIKITRPKGLPYVGKGMPFPPGKPPYIPPPPEILLPDGAEVRVEDDHSFILLYFKAQMFAEDCRGLKCRVNGNPVDRMILVDINTEYFRILLPDNGIKAEDEVFLYYDAIEGQIRRVFDNYPLNSFSGFRVTNKIIK